MSRSAVAWRRRSLVLFGVLALGILVHGAAWLWLASHRRAWAEGELRGLRDAGLSISAGPAAIGNWPGLPQVRIGTVEIAGSGWTWDADQVIVDGWEAGTQPSRLLIQGQRVRVAGGQPHPLAMPDMTAGSDGTALLLAASALEGSVAIAAGAWQARIDDHRAALTAQSVRVAGGPPFLLNTLKLSWCASPGCNIVTIEAIDASLGPARFTGTGTLDTQAFSGVGRVHVKGFAAGLDQLATEGWIDANAAMAAKAILALLATPSADGGAEVPVRIEAGVLSAAGFPLRKLY